jgi:hypothetical protein
MAGAPEGNQNARMGREWRNAINRALEKRGNGDRTKALDELAEKFLDTVEDMRLGTEKRAPSVAGFSELADRIDGKSSQSVTLGSDPDNPLLIYARELSQSKSALPVVKDNGD